MSGSKLLGMFVRKSVILSIAASHSAYCEVICTNEGICFPWKKSVEKLKLKKSRKKIENVKETGILSISYAVYGHLDLLEEKS